MAKSNKNKEVENLGDEANDIISNGEIPNDLPTTETVDPIVKLQTSENSKEMTDQEFKNALKEVKATIRLTSNTEEKTVDGNLNPGKDPYATSNFRSVSSTKGYKKSWVIENPVLAIKYNTNLALCTNARGKEDLIKKIAETDLRELMNIVSNL